MKIVRDYGRGDVLTHKGYCETEPLSMLGRSCKYAVESGTSSDDGRGGVLWSGGRSD